MSMNEIFYIGSVKAVVIVDKNGRINFEQREHNELDIKDVIEYRDRCREQAIKTDNLIIRMRN